MDADDHFGCTAAPQSSQSNKYFGTIKKTPESVALVTPGQQPAVECLILGKIVSLEIFNCIIIFFCLCKKVLGDFKSLFLYVRTQRPCTVQS